MAALVDVAGFHLLDINVRPCANLKDIISECWKLLTQGVSKGGGKAIHGFKVVGENRIIAVLDGGIESAVDSLNSRYAERVQIHCTALRSYEDFSDRVLGIDKSFTETPTRKLGRNGRLFWQHGKVDHKGLAREDRSTAMDKLLKFWAEEAEAVLGLRRQPDTDFEMDLYKIVSAREVHIFVRVADASAMDDVSFKLPLYRQLGDEIQITSKSIVHIEPENTA